MERELDQYLIPELVELVVEYLGGDLIILESLLKILKWEKNYIKSIVVYLYHLNKQAPASREIYSPYYSTNRSTIVIGKSDLHFGDFFYKIEEFSKTPTITFLSALQTVIDYLLRKKMVIAIIEVHYSLSSLEDNELMYLSVPEERYFNALKEGYTKVGRGTCRRNRYSSELLKSHCAYLKVAADALVLPEGFNG